MKKLIFGHQEKLYFLVGLVVTLSLLWPLFWAPSFTYHDDVQTIRLFEMDKCIRDLQIPCRWVPDLGGIYGYPLFNYYAPLPYYFGELFYFISHSLLISVKVMFATAMVGSFVFMYLLGRKLWGNKGGAISAVFYSFAPYHAVDFYVRGEMGEMWGLMFFPAIFWAILRLKEAPRIYNLLLVALFVALILASHNLSAMLFLPIAVVFAGFLFFQKRDSKFAKLFLLSIILGLTMSAFYWLPMNAEKNLVHIETMVEGYFSYTEHFKGLKKLFVERYWGWGPSVREIPGIQEDNMLSYQIGWVHILGWLLSLLTAVKLWRTKRSVSLLVAFSSLAILGTVFMINPYSAFVWKLVDPLKYLQFPWRFLLLTIFFISMISGSIFLWLEGKKQLFIWLGLLVLVIALNFSYFRPEKFLQVTDAQILSGKDWDREIKRSIFDFLPIFAKEPPAELATARYQTLYGDIKVSNFREGTNWFSFNADTNGYSIIRISQYYFPDWRIFVDGQQAHIQYTDNSLGLMTLILGTGQHHIEGRLENTTVRTLSNGVSGLGMLAFILLILTQVPKTRHWIFYYLKGMYR